MFVTGVGCGRTPQTLVRTVFLVVRKLASESLLEKSDSSGSSVTKALTRFRSARALGLAVARGLMPLAVFKSSRALLDALTWHAVAMVLHQLNSFGTPSALMTTTLPGELGLAFVPGIRSVPAPLPRHHSSHNRLDGCGIAE